MAITFKIHGKFTSIKLSADPVYGNTTVWVA